MLVLDLLIEIPRLIPLLSFSLSLAVFLFRSLLASGSPASPTVERAGHKSGATPTRDCNPTDYTML